MSLNISDSKNGTYVLSGPLHETLFNINFPLAVAYVVIVTLLSVVGVLGNTSVLYVMFQEKQMNRHARAFIINMACADLCVAAIADPMCIVGAFIGMDILDSVLWLCVATASLCLTVCFCVFLNMLCLTLNRWMYICHNSIYTKIYGMKTCALMCCACWVLAIFLELGNFVGWGGHYFDAKSHQCIWDRTASRSYTLFVAFVLITTPLIIIAYCNVSMIRKVMSVKANAFAKETRCKKLNSSINTVKVLLAMFLAFLICWTPYVIVISIDHLDELSMETHLFVTLLAHAHSSIVCIIYFCFKKTFRDNIRRLFCGKNMITPSPPTSDGPIRTTEADLGSKSECFKPGHQTSGISHIAVSPVDLRPTASKC